ncbi:MAG: flagellar export chaperone FliS [Planctomycetota bacterium]
MPEQDTANAYLRTKILTATPEQLRMMLLDAAVKHARQTLEAIESQDREALFENSTKCRDIVLELLGGINDEPDPDLAERVRSLYLFIYRELVDAGLNREAPKLRRVIELLEYERETWRLLMEQITRERNGADAPAPTAQQAPVTAPVKAPARNPLPYPGKDDSGPRAPLSIQA